MIEMMVAVSIMTVGLLGVFTLLSRSLGLNQIVADQYVAANLAAEGIELVKNLIDGNVLNNRPFNNGECLKLGAHEIDYNDDLNSSCLNRDIFLRFDSASGVYGYDFGENSRYKRLVVIEWPDADQIKVNSKVFWISRGGIDYEINLEDRFFNWRQ